MLLAFLHARTLKRHNRKYTCNPNFDLDLTLDLMSVTSLKTSTHNVNVMCYCLTIAWMFDVIVELILNLNPRHRDHPRAAQ